MRLTLFKKILISFLLVSIVPITFFGMVIVEKVFDITQGEVLESNAFTVKQISWQIDTYFNSIKRILEDFASFPEIKDFDKEKVTQLMSSYYGSYTVYYGHQTVVEANPFESFVILDKQGMAVAFYPERESDLVGRDYSKQEFFQEVNETKEYFISSDVIISGFTGEPVIRMAVPVIKEKQISSVIMADINIESVSSLINQARTGDTGYLFAVSNNGTIVVHPNLELVLLGENINTIAPNVFNQINEKSSGAKIAFYPEENSDTIIAYSFPQEIDWIVIFSQSLDEALAIPLEIRYQFILILALTTVLAFLVALYFSRGITNPLREFTEKVINMTVAEDLNLEINIKTKDEVGNLASAFNQMIRKLKIKRLQLEEAKLILEGRVKERTEDLEALNKSLEDKVELRTKELREKIYELNRFYKLTVGRELKMAELKKENKKLEEQIKE